MAPEAPSTPFRYTGDRFRNTWRGRPCLGSNGARRWETILSELACVQVGGRAGTADVARLLDGHRSSAGRWVARPAALLGRCGCGCREPRTTLLMLVEPSAGVDPDMYELRIPDEYVDNLPDDDDLPTLTYGVQPTFAVFGSLATFRIFHLLDRATAATAPTLAAAAHVSIRTVRAVMKDLRGQGLARRTPSGWLRGRRSLDGVASPQRHPQPVATHRRLLAGRTSRLAGSPRTFPTHVLRSPHQLARHTHPLDGIPTTWTRFVGPAVIRRARCLGGGRSAAAPGAGRSGHRAPAGIGRPAADPAPVGVGPGSGCEPVPADDRVRKFRSGMSTLPGCPRLPCQELRRRNGA